MTHDNPIAKKLGRGLMCALLMFCVPLIAARSSSAEELAAEFFIEGHENETALLNRLHQLHHERAFTTCTLWDAWLPKSTVWASAKKRQQYSDALSNRRIDEEGYVSMQQHRGMAHSEGWPFPAWQQSTGVGFHFSNLHDVWAIQQFKLKPLSSTEEWEFSGAEIQGIDPAVGLKLSATNDKIRFTTPSFRCGTVVAPFLRLEWTTANAPPSTKLRVEWLLENETEWPEDRYAEFDASTRDTMHYRNLPLYRHPDYAGVVTRYRVTVDAERGSELHLKSVITAIDTRHPITGSLFIQGCRDVFRWTGDAAFLERNLPRMRKALRFTLREFSVRELNHVDVPWVGHGGRSGLAFSSEGQKSARPGLGVGNNYWDLLPFGAHDAIATMYAYDAIGAMVELERSVRNLGIGTPAADLRPVELEKLADSIRADFQKRFWNADTGRFIGWVDVDGRRYDYGFTFVNLEAIYYGLASNEQAETILRWLDGDRIIASDTSQGADIYHWRFGPRSTTLRNVETYVWPWYHPERIPWGNQLQDGGAVLGFSYFDLMARLQTRGPDEAWSRLRQILEWFADVENEGGYRAYYSEAG
ncbi:MAG: hypothetical protein AAGJ83_14755, partial [Planctomycetota bacterium]